MLQNPPCLSMVLQSLFWFWVITSQSGLPENGSYYFATSPLACFFRGGAQFPKELCLARFPKQSEATQHETERCKANQSNAKQGDVKQSNVEQCKAKQSKANGNNTNQSNAKHHNATQKKTGRTQNKANATRGNIT